MLYVEGPRENPRVLPGVPAQRWKDGMDALAADTLATIAAGRAAVAQLRHPFSRRRRAREAGRTSVVRRGVESDTSGTT